MRTIFVTVAGAWPTYTGEFADRMNGMPEVTVSSTLADPAWNNTTVRGGDAVGGVSELRAPHGGPILVAGSKTLVHTLLDRSLVDDLRLMVLPETTRKVSWNMVDTRTFPSGVRVHAYRTRDRRPAAARGGVLRMVDRDAARPSGRQRIRRPVRQLYGLLHVVPVRPHQPG
ncbi:MAG: dihydrofolate reductase family protein [Acidimicrobiales bacterium]